MTFLHASLLSAGLGAIAIPVLIHLLMRRRRKPMPWGAMRFVLEAYRKTRRRLLLERWLLLALRCLLLALVALALGRPVSNAGQAGARASRVVYLVIDNSIASAAGDGARALQRHVAQARAVLAELGDSDRVGLIALGGPAEALAWPPTGNLGGVRDVLDRLRPTDSRADLPGALRLIEQGAADAAGGEGSARRQAMVVVLSDLRAGAVDLDTALPRLPAGLRLVVASPPPEGDGPAVNAAIRDVRAARSVLLSGRGEASQVVGVTLLRSGPGVDQPGTSTLRLSLDSDTPAGNASGGTSAGGRGEATLVRWSAGQREARVTAVLESPAAAPSAAQAAVITARLDADALANDNVFRVPVEVRETLRVGIIAGPRESGRGPESLGSAQWLELALRPRDDASIELSEVDPAALDAARLSGLDSLLIADPARVSDSDWPRVRQFAEGFGLSSGGLVVIFPPADRRVHTWTDPMLRGLGLPWEMALEAQSTATGDAPPPRIAAGTVGDAGAASGVDLFAAIRGEFADLAPPVNVRTILPVLGKAQGAPALALADGTGLIWVATPGEGASPESAGTSKPGGRGAIVYVAFALNLQWTDLPVKPLMVPLVQELVRQGVGRARPGAWALAGARPTAPAQSIRLRAWGAGEGEDASIALDETAQPPTPMRWAGVWDAIDARGGRRGVITLNPDALGARLDRPEPAALQAWLNPASGTGQAEWLGATSGSLPPDAPVHAGFAELSNAASTGQPHGPGWLWVALGVALFELVLARRASHAPTLQRTDGLPASA
jgi:hypothetical protein